MSSRDHVLINWIKNRQSTEAPANEADEAPDEVEEKFAPVGVRVDPPVAVRVKPADTYVAGYNVDEDGFGVDDEHSTTVNDIKTTGVDPYDMGFVDQSDSKKSVPKK